jgi:hypothetical protein
MIATSSDQKEVLMNKQSVRPQFRIGYFACAAAKAQPNRQTALTLLVLSVLVLCLPRTGLAQQTIASAAPVPKASPSAASTATRILIPAPLASSVDSKKLKTGDEVVLKTTANLSWTGGATIPRGSKVVGHVTEAKARANGDAQSSLAIAFDKVNLSDGKSIAITGVVQAVGANLRDASPGGGGVGYTDLQEATYSPSVSSAGHPVAMLNSQSVGVVGIKNLQLSADGVLTSSEKSVKLDSGSQMLLLVQETSGH